MSEDPDVAGQNVNAARADTPYEDIGSSVGGSFWNAILQKTVGVTYRLLNHIRGSLLIAVKTSSSSTSKLQMAVLNAFSANGEYGLITGAGAHTWSAPAAVSVGVADTAVLSAITTAKVIILTNTSGAYISIACGNAAVLYSGITLNPSGGVAILSAADGTLPAAGQTVRAIASAAASNLGVQVLT